MSGVAVPLNNVITAGCLYRANRAPAAELTGLNGCAVLFQLGARAAAIKIRRSRDPRQAGGCSALDRCRDETDHPVAVQILVEGGLERFQRGAASRYGAGIGG